MARDSVAGSKRTQRKSLIAPGSVLPPRTPAPDLLANIIRHDREASGRGRREENQEIATVLSTSRKGDNTESGKDDNLESRQVDNLTSQQSDNTLANREILGELLALAGDEARRPITFKIPNALDDALVEYLRDRWRDRFQKQDILTRGAILALYELKTGTRLVEFGDE